MRKIQPIDIMRFYVEYHDTEKEIVETIRNEIGKKNTKLAIDFLTVI